jgi:hypothetical protein
VYLGKNESGNKIIFGSSQSKSWIASEAQLTYTFDIDSIILRQASVYVGGVLQIPDVNFLEDSPTRVTLICNLNKIQNRIEVVTIINKVVS